MNRFKLLVGLLVFCLFLCAAEHGLAQITSTADQIILTEYSSGAQDSIHIFCSAKAEKNASLIASFPGGETGSFEWSKYNSIIGDFDFYSSEASGSSTSTISNLADGCYRVKLSGASGIKTYTAWVFNNYIEATADITDSDCSSFKLNGTFDTPQLIYTDLTNGQPKELSKDISVKWLAGDVQVSRVATSVVYSPPAKNTDYTFEVTDRFGCTATGNVLYNSIVTKASFEYAKEDQGKYNDPQKPEAPLKVTFTNTSENGDAGKYEWFIFKDRQKIKDEIAAGTFKDSIKEVIYSDNMVYTFEETGEYRVKLVSKKVSELTTCVDTFYMDGYITIEESFLDAPNVFTPGISEGNNDTFAVLFKSMKSMKISIFNRWGKLLHVWENNNIPGFSKTVEESVWDGKIGGHFVSSGVYYYVAEGVGRDGKRRHKTGFFHLFGAK